MNGLAGTWNFDGRSVERELLAAIGSPLAHRGPDGSGDWQGGGIAMTVRSGRVRATDDQQPLTDAAGTALAFDGRLDNRAQLLTLMSRRDVAAGSTDAALVFEAFRIWGNDSLQRLEGDFALALYNARERHLVLARDPIGCRPLYYWTNGRCVVFGSEIKSLLAHPDIPCEPNEDLLADFFLRDQVPYEDEGETFFRDIHAVLPGCRVIVSAQSRRSERFWDFDPQHQTRCGSYSAYADRLRELLIQAVKRRIRTDHPVAIATSGGLDSSIVLCIADDLRKSGAVRVPILPMWCMPPAPHPTDEERSIDLLESERGLCVERIAMGAPGDRDELQTLARSSEWPQFDDGWCALRPMLARAHSRGASTLLTGDWSDQFFFVTGYLSDLCTRLKWRQVVNHLQEYSRWFVDADPAYFRSRFRRDLAFNLTPHGLRTWLRPLLGSFTNHEDSLAGPLLAARINRRRTRVPRPRCATAHARDIYQATRVKSHRLQFEADAKVAAGWGIEFVTPFLDRDVVAFLMSIPGEIQSRGGVPRALLRDSMRGIVPDAILARRWNDQDTALTDERLRMYLSQRIGLEAAGTLGFVRRAPAVDRESLEFLGLEFWSRAFFSDRLTSLRRSRAELVNSCATPSHPRNMAVRGCHTRRPS